MSPRVVLPMSVFALLMAAMFSSKLRADDGVVQMSNTPYYYHYRLPHRQPPNPTYWTWMPCPLHGGCNTCWDARCPSGKGVWTTPAVRWMLDPNYYAVAPDHGWSPPDKAALNRGYITYGQYHPEEWYGTGSPGRARQVPSYPIVGQPTDTAQLGNYYQQVPMWKPRPDMVPGTPDPRNWHWRPNQVGADGTRRAWVRLRQVWAPLDQIPGRTAPQPAPQVVPAPVPEPAPVPALPNIKAPRALNEPVDGAAVRRAGL